MQICIDILMTFMNFVTHGNVIFDILELLHLENIAHVGSNRILKKLMLACMVNVIHSKALPGSGL